MIPFATMDLPAWTFLEQTQTGAALVRQVEERPPQKFPVCMDYTEVGFPMQVASQIFEGQQQSGFEPVIRALQDFARWEINWDGYGARTISDAAISDALRFIQNLPRDVQPPKAMAGSDGSVGLYWEAGAVYVSIDFDGDGTYCYIADIGDDELGAEGVPVVGELPAQLLSRIPSLVEMLA